MPTSILISLLSLVACKNPSVGEGDYPFAVSTTAAEDVPTVLTVTWSTDLEDVGNARVEFGPDTSYGHEATSTTSGGAGEALLLGSKPNTEVHLRVVAETDDDTYTSDDFTITTGPAPAALPNLEVTSTGDDHWSGYLVTGIVASAWSVILDEDGDYVWWHEASGAPDGTHGGPDGGGNGGVVLGRTALARDGSGVWYTFNNIEAEEQVTLHHVTWDGATVTQVPAPYAHHEFVELPDGTIAYPAYDPQNVDGLRILGDRIMELAPDGTEREVWNAWDHLEFDADDVQTRPNDWPHLNAIDYLPDLDAYLVGFLSLGSLCLVDRTTGETLLTVGGEGSDYGFGEAGGTLDTQHQFEWLDGELLVFVNGGMQAGSESRAQQFVLDDATGIAEETWSYWPSPSLNTTNLGDVDRLASGNTLVTFSTSGQVHEVTPDGTVVWKLVADVGGALSYSHLEAELDVAGD